MASVAGFSLTEAMISIAVLGIIATASIFSLTSSQRADQLNTAARVIEADLRSLQARALTSENVKTCISVGGSNVTCELDVLGCVPGPPCLPQPPAAVGMRLAVNQSAYDFFAEVEPSTAGDWAMTNTGEKYLTRALAASGAPNVIISAISAGSPTDVAFERQNGSMVINGCRVSQGCNTTTALTITLKQTQTGITRTVTMNAYTGRISIQ